MPSTNGEHFPTVSQLEAELTRRKTRKNTRKIFMSTLYVLITVAAIAVLVSTLWMPVFQIYGNSMSPTLQGGDIVMARKTKVLHTGDLCAFYVNDKILVKRVIGLPGDWVNITSDGLVYVNNQPLDEPYVLQHTLGETDVEFPLRVPRDRYFVLGDHRTEAADSRHSDIGCIDRERMVGQLLFRIWPLSEFGGF